MQKPRRLDANRIDRRTFLLGAAATGALAACSSGGDDFATLNAAGSASSEPGNRVVAEEFRDDSADLAPDMLTIIQRYPQDVQVPGEVRLPFSLAGDDAQFVTDGPLSLGAQVVDLDGNAIGPRLEAVRRDVTPAPYYAFRAQIDEPGFYGIMVDGGPETGANFQVFEPAQVGIPLPGQPLPGFDTPTVGEPGTVDPICTRDPACPFHSVTLAEALASDKAVAYLVGTPALCVTGSCTPALEALVEVESEFADDFVFVHAEVWTDSTATVLAPAVESLEMNFEPALFITARDGVIVERLDGLWDVTELRERLRA